MNYPTGRECSEGDCQWLASKRGVPAATSDRKPTDYECIGKPSYWPECPRAIRWRLAEAERLGDELAAAAQSDWDCTDDRGDDAMRIAARLDAALTAWRNRGQS